MLIQTHFLYVEYFNMGVLPVFYAGICLTREPFPNRYGYFRPLAFQFLAARPASAELVAKLAAENAFSARGRLCSMIAWNATLPAAMPTLMDTARTFMLGPSIGFRSVWPMVLAMSAALPAARAATLHRQSDPALMLQLKSSNAKS